MLCVPPLDYFSVFGISTDPVEFSPEANDRNFSLTAPLGDQRTLFLQTPASNVAETTELVVIKLGSLYHTSGEFLTPSDLINRKLATRDQIQYESLRGDGLVICLSRFEARLLMYRAVLAVPEVYFQATDDGILCADNLGSLIKLLSRPQLDETIIPHHMMFRLVCGNRTYIQDVKRIRDGEMVCWQDGNLKAEQVKSLRDLRPEKTHQTLDNAAFEAVDHPFGEIMSGLRPGSAEYGTLLSGGVDSSLLQGFLKESDPTRTKFYSFSYDVKTPIFQPEAEYASAAAQALKTQHSFISVTPENYVEWTVGVMNLLGQPALAEQEACHFGLARCLPEQHPEITAYFIGYGADALMGGSLAEIWWHLDEYQHYPAVSWWLPPVEMAMRRIDTHKAFVLRRVLALLPQLEHPFSPEYPGNEYELYTDFDLAARCFGQQALEGVLNDWHEVESSALGSTSIVERSQLMSYLNTERTRASFVHQIYAACGLELIFPYHDERLVQSFFSIDASVRFYHQGSIKPVLKGLLARKSAVNSSQKPKLGSGFYDDLKDWMKNGVFRDRVQAIERPSYIEKHDFERKLAEPDWFTWNMLTLDLYKKHVLN